MPLWQVFPTILCHTTLLKRAEIVNPRMGISITAADAEGIEEPKKRRSCCWSITCGRNIALVCWRSSGQRWAARTSSTLSSFFRDGLARLLENREAATLVGGKEMLLYLRGIRGHLGLEGSKCSTVVGEA